MMEQYIFNITIDGDLKKIKVDVVGDHYVSIDNTYVGMMWMDYEPDSVWETNDDMLKPYINIIGKRYSEILEDRLKKYLGE